MLRKKIRATGKMTVMDIRHMPLTELRQGAVCQLDTITLLEQRITSLEAQLRGPIPMILFCPMCGARHVDKGKFATEPHKSHSCQGCGFTWSPSHRHTVGVQFLPGYKDEEPTREGSMLTTFQVAYDRRCPAVLSGTIGPGMTVKA